MATSSDPAEYFMGLQLLRIRVEDDVYSPGTHP